VRQDWRCILCGRSIGAFERLVLVGAGGERETSRAAEPDLVVGRERLYHAVCLARHEDRTQLASQPVKH